MLTPFYQFLPHVFPLVQFLHLFLGVSGTPLYTWSGPGANSSNFINASVWQNLSSGWYYFTIEDDICSESDSAFIDLLDSPQANVLAIPNNGCSPLDVVFVNSSSNATTFEWDFNDGNTQNSQDTNAITHVFTSQTATVFSVQLIASQNGNCPDTLVIPVDVEICGCRSLGLNFDPNATFDDGSCIQPEPVIKAPNVFTPNGDNSNDAYTLSWENLISLELTILNRGEMSFMKKIALTLLTMNLHGMGKIKIMEQRQKRELLL